MAKLPKEYLICAKKFDLDKKVPRLSIDDFLNLSLKVLKACQKVTVKTDLTRKQHKELGWFANEYKFKISIYPKIVDTTNKKVGSYPDNGSKNNIGKAISHPTNEADVTISTPDAVTSAVTDARKLIEELERPRKLSTREYVVKVHGKPKPKPKEDKDYIVMTAMGPMPASSLGLVRRHEPIFVTLNVMSLPGHGPLIQEAYYDRIALAEALVAKLPWQASVRDRNALKFHICREMSDEEVTNLAVDTMAQYELVKGYTVKK